MDERDKNLLQRALQDDIEILLEDFEDVTGRRVTTISVSRMEVDERKCHKSFEYKAEIL